MCSLDWGFAGTTRIVWSLPLSPFFGLGFKHLYTVQEILRLVKLVQHSFQHSLTGQLYTTSLELLHIELGLLYSLHKIDLNSWLHLGTTALVKSSWQFLWSNKIHLKTTITEDPPREGDSLIMLGAYHDDIEPGDLSAINKCRLYLHTLYLSDIVDGSSTYILQEAWTGERKINEHRIES